MTKVYFVRHAQSSFENKKEPDRTRLLTKEAIKNENV